MMSFSAAKLTKCFQDAVLETNCGICFIDPYDYHMDLCNELCSSLRLAFHLSCIAKTLTLDITCKLSPNFSYLQCLLAPLTSTIWFYYWSCWGLQGQHKAKPFGVITFHLIRMKYDVIMKHFKLNILRLFLSKIYWNKGNNCCFTDCLEKLWFWHAFRHLWIDLVQTWCDDRY